MKFIQSVKNPQVKQWKKLQAKKERDKSGLYIIEGFHLIEEAIRYQKEAILELIVSEKVDLPTTWNVDGLSITIVTEDVLKSIAETEAPQGVVAICKQHANGWKPTYKKVLMIDAVQDPGNVGTMIRTADAAGIDAVIIGEGTVDIYNSKVLRSAQGSHFHLSIIRGNLHEWIENLSMHNIPVYGTALEGAIEFTSIEKPKKFALIVGNEGSGVNKELLKRTNQNLYVPIHGKSESLNVAVAAGILMYALK